MKKSAPKKGTAARSGAKTSGPARTAAAKKAAASKGRAGGTSPGTASSRKPSSRKTASGKPSASRTPRAPTTSASELIDARIKELGDWRGAMLSRLRALVREADPEVIEEWKWRGVPVWSHAGMICTGETYQRVVKMTFAKGAALPDPARLFNSSLEGNTRRAIDLHQGDAIDEQALQALVRAAVDLNNARAKR